LRTDQINEGGIVNMAFDRYGQEPETRLPKLDPRVRRKCEASLVRAVGALPDFLLNSEPEAAARIAADLVKAVMAHPEPAPEKRSWDDVLAQLYRMQLEKDSWQKQAKEAEANADQKGESE